MRLAEQARGQAAVQKIVKSVVPVALNDVAMEDSVPWSQRGDDYAAARLELLKLLDDNGQLQSGY